MENIGPVERLPAVQPSDVADPIPLSALQHFIFCPRQCALIHVERVWAENVHTAQGRVLHEKVDKPAHGRRGEIRSVAALALFEPELGIQGVADLVEFHAVAGGVEQPVPVEYKRGRPKSHRADDVQLCAQALCLEHMYGTSVPQGVLFYGANRRRVNVPIDPELRQLTRTTIEATRAMIDGGRTPPAHFTPARCDNCSLIDICEPRWFGASSRGTVRDWVRRVVRDGPSGGAVGSVDDDMPEAD